MKQNGRRWRGLDLSVAGDGSRTSSKPSRAERTGEHNGSKEAKNDQADGINSLQLSRGYSL